MKSLSKFVLFCLFFCGINLVGFSQTEPVESGKTPHPAPEKISGEFDWVTDSTGAYTVLKEEKGELTYTKVARNNKTGEVLTYNEEYPQFKGGKNKLYEFQAKSTKYPADALRKNISGMVRVKFTVTETGEIKDIQILEGVTESLDNEAIRVVSKMPRWIPGKQNGKLAPATMILPFRFNLY